MLFLATRIIDCSHLLLNLLNGWKVFVLDETWTWGYRLAGIHPSVQPQRVYALPGL